MAATDRYRWYVVHVYSGFENKIIESIREQAEKKGIEEHFAELMVPSEQVVEVRRGKKVDAERKFFPGYILVKMVLSDEAWSLVKNTPKVTNFLGARNKPVPITEKEAMSILQQVQEGVDRPRPAITYKVGQDIKVIDGPFASFNGVVEEIDEERGRLKVSVSIFGRATPVELEYTQVEEG